MKSSSQLSNHFANLSNRVFFLFLHSNFVKLLHKDFTYIILLISIRHVIMHTWMHSVTMMDQRFEVQLQKKNSIGEISYKNTQLKKFPFLIYHLVVSVVTFERSLLKSLTCYFWVAIKTAFYTLIYSRRNSSRRNNFFVWPILNNIEL